METKKDIVAYCNQILYYFNKMWEFGGSYKEKRDSYNKKLITFEFPNKMKMIFPVTDEEYTYWRSIKPKLLKGDKICP